MSRSGYSNCLEGGNLNLYRANVDRSIKGKVGQKFLKELAESMDAMPEKVLIAGHLISLKGCCAIGVVCKARGLDVSGTDIEDPERVGKLVGISTALAAEIEYLNDEDGDIWRDKAESPAGRWLRMREWVNNQLEPKGS